MKTRDIDIRRSLKHSLTLQFNDDPDTLILDELGLCQGVARVDIAVVNGSLHGYEIKSEKDTLARLPGQINIYNKVLDEITIITGQCHLENVMKIIPYWWGIQIAEMDEENYVVLNTIREPEKNPYIDSYSIAQLLWREEALDLLRRFELEKGFISKPRQKIWEKLSHSFSLVDLKYYVREQIKSRQNWRSETQQMICGD